MHKTRRDLIRLTGASALTLATGACMSSGAGPQSPEASRRLMINANMPIPFDSDGALDAETKAQLRATGLSAVKTSIGGSGGTFEDVHAELDYFAQELARNADIYVPVDSVADIDLAFASRRIGVIKSFEAATMFEDDPARIREFAGRGVRIMQLGYNTTNAFGAGVMSREGRLGLTREGREAISEMETSGVLLDLSHAHPETTRDAIAAARKPVGLTHTGCASIHAHPRNKSDEILRAVSETGGVTGIYEMSYLTPDLEQTPLTAFMAHLTHAIKVCGEDHVGIGSDSYILTFDTSPESKARWDAVNAARKAAGIAAPGEGPMPFVVGLNGPQRMEVIARELKKAGVGSAAIDKIMGHNFKRVFKDTWA